MLLHGVTGSGKTEVYLQAAQAALEAGRSVLLLVPEIGLTGQTVARVRARFAGEQVAVLHSGLSAGERLAAYAPVARGEVRIVVGARSAVFAPLGDLGLIVVDEEHDTSYKQESEPAYDARTVARWRAGAAGAVVVLGSATPSVESFARVPLTPTCAGAWTARSRRALEIVDMRDVHGVFSPPLAAALTATVDAGEKAILFLNRRGFASYLVCDHCGHTWDVPALRRDARRCSAAAALRCRTCGHAEPAPSVVPGVRQPRPRAPRVRHGAPRARGAPAAARRRAAAPRLRRRRRPTRACAHVLDRFAEPGAKVLVGTQMIAKGHHFPDVTLVGVVNADLTLHFPDFRAEERTFAMLIQVGGRSGRGDAAGPRDRADARPGGAADRPRGRRRGGALLRRGARAPAGARLPAGAAARRPRALRARRATRRAWRAGFTAERLRAALGDTASRCSAPARSGGSAAVTPAGS